MGVLIVGSLNIDIVTYLERMPEPGETVVGELMAGLRANETSGDELVALITGAKSGRG